MYAIDAKPFSTLALKPFHLSNCYYHQDLLSRLFPSRSLYTRFSISLLLPPTFHYFLNKLFSTNPYYNERRVSEIHFSAIHFRDRSIRQVSCYTLLSGFRLPWPPSCCLDESTPFLGSVSVCLWLLNSSFGSSHIASSAYQIWPTCGLLYLFSHYKTMHSSPFRSSLCTTSKFENKSRLLYTPL